MRGTECQGTVHRPLGLSVRAGIVGLGSGDLVVVIRVFANPKLVLGLRCGRQSPDRGSMADEGRTWAFCSENTSWYTPPRNRCSCSKDSSQ